MSVSKKTLQKRICEIQKTLNVFEFLMTHSSDSSNLPNEKKPQIESLSVTELCSKYYFVTVGVKDEVSLRLNVMNVFKSMLKCEFNDVCDMYLKSLHTLLSSQSSDTFRVSTIDNLSYLMIGEQSQFILIPREVDINNFKQNHKKLILEHACNFYQFSIEKKEQVLKLQIDKKKPTPKNGRNVMKVASSLLGKRKQCESQTPLVPQEGLMENKKRKKQQRKPKNQANDAMIDSLLTDDPTLVFEKEKNPIEPEERRKGEGEEEMTTSYHNEHHTKAALPTDSNGDSTEKHANTNVPTDSKGDSTPMYLPNNTPSEINTSAADLHTAGDVMMDEDNSSYERRQDLYVKDVNTMLGYSQSDDDISYGSFND